MPIIHEYVIKTEDIQVNQEGIMTAAITIQSLNKLYGNIPALVSFDLEVAKGTIFGLLGPNGAGKTTLIRIMTTLMRPTSGRVLVAGLDTSTNGKDIRRLIGVVPQENSLDRYLTARENLELHARLHEMSNRAGTKRIDELLELFGLAGRQNDFPDTFSGGMQRRLVVARALVHQPEILFLDEPTTGLDPQSRHAVWDYVKSLAGSMTIFLTTHYLEEADQLCERIAIMDHGRVITEGSATELKERLTGGALYEIEFGGDPDEFAEKLRTLSCILSLNIAGQKGTIELGHWECLSAVLSALSGSEIRRISLKERTLEEVFISLTGKGVRE